MPTTMFNRRTVLLAVTSLVVVTPGASAARPLITVHKDPNCECCGGWVTHLVSHGFRAKILLTKELNRHKARLGVPSELWSCHTAEMDGYVIEGHVPAPAIDKLLAEQPRARGLAVPGMPSGSPGMSGEAEEFEVILFGANDRRTFGRFKGEREI